LDYNNHNDLENHATLSLEYGKKSSHIEVSWIPNYKLRNLYIYESNKYFILDYILQKLISYRAPPRATFETMNWDDFLWISRNIEENIPVEINEPAKLELKCFIHSIKKDKLLEPLCQPFEALEVLKVLKYIYENKNK